MAFASTSYYQVHDIHVGVFLQVVEVFAIPGSQSVCELALGADLVGGETYNVTASQVPSAGGSFTAQLETLVILVSDVPNALRAVDEPTGSLADEIYGEDLVWSDGDMVEDPTGDLASAGGTGNVVDALERRLVSDGLDWDENYGGQLRRFVDGPRATAGEMRGLCTSQLLLDDRAQSASTRVTSFEQSPLEHVAVECSVVLVGGESVQTQAMVKVG